MAGRGIKPFMRKGKYRSQAMATSMNAPASARGLGGGLLIGFSTCDDDAVDGKGQRAPVAGVTYVAPLSRLRAVHQDAGKMYWHFEPIIGTQTGATDIITLDLLQALSTDVWGNIANLLGGNSTGDTFAWVHNACSRGNNVNENPVLIPGVTAIAIALAS